jgi:prepilin-type N-terminal cleavage/methylation domain-containing protein
MRNKQKGFSLIELLIVVAIILIIAAIAIPNLLRSKMAANEASAVASLRTINTAEVVYSTTYNTTNVFADSLAQLGGSACTGVPTSAAACLIDPALAAATTSAKSGYIFTYTPGSGTYTVQADPQQQNSTGIRHFFTDQSNVIRVNQSTTATVGDSAL